MIVSTLNRLQPALMAVAVLFAFGTLTASAEAKSKKPVSVFPSPKTPVASDKTTFSFRGLKPKNLGKVKIFASETGRHGIKRRLEHSDGQGVSVIPERAFEPGEKVKVYTGKRIKRARKGDFWVRIGEFYGNDDKSGKPGEKNEFPALRSRPDLRPTPISVETSTPEAAPGKIFFAPSATGMTIADNFGRTSWFRPVGFGGKGERIFAFERQEYKGRPVLTYWKGSSSSLGFSQIGTFEILNRKYNRIAKFKPGNGYEADIHEFTITERDTALVLAYRGVKADLSKYGGDEDGKVFDAIVQEIDIKTGAVVFEFHSIGNISFGSNPQGAAPGAVWDYAHLNAVAADGKSVLISSNVMSTIFRVNRRNGRLQWKLRGDGQKPKSNDFKLEDGLSWGYQHDVRRLPNGDISIFNNGVGFVLFGTPDINDQSSGLILRLSGKGKNRRVSEVKRFEHPSMVRAFAIGSARAVSTGGMIVNWGLAPRITEFGPSGDIVFDATFTGHGGGPAAGSYRGSKGDWIGKPKDRPAIASEADGAGAKVWASWNGATDIREWKVLTGSSAGSLTEVGSSSWRDLETMIAVPTVDSKVRVVAYGPDGEKLGQSGLIAVGKQSR